MGDRPKPDLYLGDYSEIFWDVLDELLGILHYEVRPDRHEAVLKEAGRRIKRWLDAAETSPSGEAIQQLRQSRGSTIHPVGKLRKRKTEAPLLVEYEHFLPTFKAIIPRKGTARDKRDKSRTQTARDLRQAMPHLSQDLSVTLARKEPREAVYAYLAHWHTIGESTVRKRLVVDRKMVLRASQVLRGR